MQRLWKGVEVVKFKVGDKVRVREDLKKRVVEMPSGISIVITEEMIDLADDVVTISSVGKETYKVEELKYYEWTDEMLEPIEDPLADKIVERNNKQKLNTGDPWIDNLPEEYFEMYEEEELVNHPAHYTQGSMETIEKIELLLTKEEYTGFLKGNIIKYDDRMNHKGDAENDLQKSKWYAERLRSSYYGGTNPLD